MNKLMFLLGTLLLLAGCDGGQSVATGVDIGAQESEPEVAALVEKANVPGIQWFDGTIDEAFAHARHEQRPLFLYWGAVWCPPCQEIKSTVFKSQAFIELSRLFVPVYLDGDTDRAQALGDQFGVMGYPTMIVFNPDGEEVTRLPGGIDISRYNSVLALSLDQMTPTSALVQRSLQAPETLSENDFFQLAYYSWYQDASAIPPETSSIAVFESLTLAAPAGELRSRFLMLYLVALSESEQAVSRATIDVSAELSHVLSSDTLTLASWDTLAYGMEDLLGLPALESMDTALFANQWAENIFALRFSDSLSKAEKLAGWFPRLYLLTRDKTRVADDVAEQLRAEMAAVDRATPDNFERQSIVNQIAHVYRMAGMIEEAKALLTKELTRSASPYYFMSSLAGLYEAQGEFEQALRWRSQAFADASGEATRFQWGTGYVMAMIRMSPDNTTLIAQQSADLLAAFQQPDQLFTGRNFRYLQRLHEALFSWRQATGAMLEAPDSGYDQQLKSLCSQQAVGSQAALNCLSLTS